MNAPGTATSSEPITDAASLLASTIRYADAHYARENWLAARDFLSLAVEIDPGYPRLLGSLGSLQFQLQEYPAACTTFSAAVRQTPNDPDLHIQLAMVHLKLDHPEAAEAALNRALGLRPNDPTALKLLADSKRDHGRYQEAGAIYGKLINRHPDQVGVFLSLAKCFYKVGDREGTQAALEFVLTLDPNNEIARENLTTLQVPGARKQIPGSSFIQSSPVHQSDMDSSTAVAVPRSTLNSVKAMVRRLAALPFVVRRRRCSIDASVCYLHREHGLQPALPALLDPWHPGSQTTSQQSEKRPSSGDPLKHRFGEPPVRVRVLAHDVGRTLAFAGF